MTTSETFPYQNQEHKSAREIYQYNTKTKSTNLTPSEGLKRNDARARNGSPLYMIPGRFPDTFNQLLLDVLSIISDGTAESHAEYHSKNHHDTNPNTNSCDDVDLRSEYFIDSGVTIL